METFLVILFIIILLVFVLHYYIVPKKDKINIIDVPKTYFIESENTIDIQKNFECAAFSSAYLLRHFNIEADGNELYRKFPRKLFNGNVAPKGVITFFEKQNYKASFHKGDIVTLKKRISKGIPVIVFTKVFPQKKYLHFVPVIGYDDEYLYFAESLKYLINCNEKNYNRKTRIAEFDTVWKTWIPLYKNTYILIHK
jgi:hypothetical protein